MGSEIEASYEVPASCYAPCIPFDKLSAQSTFQELVGIVKSPNHLEMKVDKISYNEIGSWAHFFLQEECKFKLSEIIWHSK